MSSTRRGLAFEQWQAAVEAEVLEACGLRLLDLPDWDYWSAWDAGQDPVEAAVDLLVDAGQS